MRRPGKKIFLEKIPSIWKRLKFLQKITLRNMFLSKKRLLMTMIGVAGCVILMLTGLGLSHVVKTVAKNQFTNIQKYQVEIQYEKELQAPNNGINVHKTVLNYHNGAIVFVNGDETLNQFIGFDHDFKNDQVIVSKKFAEKFKLKICDVLVLETYDKEKQYTFKIDGLTKNYVGNYIYVGKKMIDEKNNTILLQTNLNRNGIEKQYADKSKTIIYSQDIEKEVTTMIDSIGLVITMMIIFSLLLMFVVIFNLTSININERQKELATLKVLGFYPKEVKQYIFKEVVLLTVVGTLLGLILGKPIFKHILKTVESANIMFENELNWMINITTFFISIFMMFVVNYMMQTSITKINMLEALKSHE